jgi:DNA-binding transcriptional LysR family regulator
MDLTLRQVRCFVAIADAGTFSLAASALNISQSAITESIQSLEAKTGIKLFKRHSRGVTLTRDGYRFLSHARKIVAAVSDASQALKDSNLNPSGTVRLGIPPTVAGYMLASLVANFHRVYPNITLKITELYQNEMEQQLIDGTLDVAVTLVLPQMDPKHIELRTIISARRRLWLGQKHRLVSATKVRLADIAKEPYLLLTTDDNTKTTLLYWKAHGLKPNVHFRTVSLESVRSLVAANAGVTILSDIVYRPWTLDGERVVAREIADKLPEIKIGIAWKRKRDIDECVKLFRDFCLERIGVGGGMENGNGFS